MLKYSTTKDKFTATKFHASQISDLYFPRIPIIPSILFIDFLNFQALFSMLSVIYKRIFLRSRLDFNLFHIDNPFSNLNVHQIPLAVRYFQLVSDSVSPIFSSHIHAQNHFPASISHASQSNFPKLISFSLTFFDLYVTNFHNRNLLQPEIFFQNNLFRPLSNTNFQ